MMNYKKINILFLITSLLIVMLLIIVTEFPNSNTKDDIAKVMLGVIMFLVLLLSIIVFKKRL